MFNVFENIVLIEDVGYIELLEMLRFFIKFCLLYCIYCGCCCNILIW